MPLGVRLLICFLALINICLLRKISKSILHPVCICSLFWTVLILAPVLFWNVKYEWNGYGLAWIMLANTSMIIGALIINRGKCKNPFPFSNIVDIASYQKKHNWKITYIFLALAFVSVALSVVSNGFSLSSFSSFDALVNTSTEMAYRKYNPLGSASALVQLLSVFCPASMLCCGYSINYAQEKKEKIICLICFIPEVMEVVFTTAKSGMIAAVILFLAGWCVSYMRLHHDLPYIRIKVIVLLLLGFGVVLFFLYFVMLLRIGDFSSNGREIINEKFAVYALGEVIEYDAWFATGKEFHLYQLGANTYMTIPRLLGLIERVDGVYDVSYVAEYGNVYTAFRGIIMDYGLLGGLVYSFVRGAVVQLCYNKLVGYNGKRFLPAFFVACQYFFGIYGFIISPWVYTSYILCMIAFYVYMVIFDRNIKVII